MPTTLLVDPNCNGHHLQAVANVAAVARRRGDVVFLTSVGATSHPAYDVFLREADLEVIEVLDGPTPRTEQMVEAIRAVIDERPIDEVVLLDADQALKRWWYLAPRALGLRRRPRVVFFLTRYPTRIPLGDWRGWRLRIPKAALVLVARMTGTLHHVGGFAGRDDTSTGWVVKRVRDPDICLYHSRDRARLRQELGLPLDRTIVGVFGVMERRRNAPLIWEALQVCGIDADLLLAGKQTPEVRAWVASLPPSELGRVISYDDFLPNELMDKLVAASDVAPIALTNNGPSGIMGKAIAADVPVVTAGSKVRARELLAADAGELAELDARSIGEAIQRVLAYPPDRPRRNTVPPATPQEFGEKLLGVDSDGLPIG